MHLIDSHCHLDFPVFNLDREQILSHCHDLAVNQIIVPAVTAETWPRLLAVCSQSKMLFPALGLHPMFMAEHKPHDITLLEEAVNSSQPIAIGEIGLDFFQPNSNKAAQQRLFQQQLDIAKAADLPVLLHVRKAHDETLSLLRRYRVKGGIAHAFSGSYQQAEHYLKLGFLFGVGGTITRTNATRLRKLICDLPLTSLVLETDAPDMPLADQHNRRNTPENIPEILATLAELRPEPIEQIAEATTQNMKGLFPDLF